MVSTTKNVSLRDINMLRTIGLSNLCSFSENFDQVFRRQMFGKCRKTIHTQSNLKITYFSKRRRKYLIYYLDTMRLELYMIYIFLYDIIKFDNF